MTAAARFRDSNNGGKQKKNQAGQDTGENC